MSHRRTVRSTLTTALVAGPLALALVACGSDDDDLAPSTTASPSPVAPDATTDGQAPAEQPSQAPSSDPSTSGGGSETLLAAARTALASVDGAVLFSIDGESSGWDVTLVSPDGTENDVDVAPDGGSITRGPDADADDDGDDLAERQQLLTDVALDYAAAIEAAAASVPAGTVTGADLDLDDGVATWDVQFDEDTPDELTVTVDAVSGEVLRTERDD